MRHDRGRIFFFCVAIIIFLVAFGNLFLDIFPEKIALFGVMFACSLAIRKLWPNGRNEVWTGIHLTYGEKHQPLISIERFDLHRKRIGSWDYRGMMTDRFYTPAGLLVSTTKCSVNVMQFKSGGYLIEIKDSKGFLKKTYCPDIFGDQIHGKIRGPSFLDASQQLKNEEYILQRVGIELDGAKFKILKDILDQRLTEIKLNPRTSLSVAYLP